MGDSAMWTTTSSLARADCSEGYSVPSNGTYEKLVEYKSHANENNG